MSQIEEIPRTVPGAELFFGQSVAQYLADLSDQMFQDEAETEGFLLGRFYRDAQGVYALVSGVTQDMSDAGSAVGWFRISSDPVSVFTKDLRRINALFGISKVYIAVLDSVNESMAMYSAENGTVSKIRSVMVENL